MKIDWFLYLKKAEEGQLSQRTCSRRFVDCTVKGIPIAVGSSFFNWGLSPRNPYLNQVKEMNKPPNTYTIDLLTVPTKFPNGINFIADKTIKSVKLMTSWVEVLISFLNKEMNSIPNLLEPWTSFNHSFSGLRMQIHYWNIDFVVNVHYFCVDTRIVLQSLIHHFALRSLSKLRHVKSFTSYGIIVYMVLRSSLGIVYLSLGWKGW